MIRRHRIAALAVLSLTGPAGAQGAADPGARIAAFAHRVERLEDQDAIENLQASYGYYFDKGLWDQVAGLFSVGGTFEYGQRGVYVGPAHIRRALLLFGPQGPAAGHLNNHMQLQNVTIVADDGRTATARWQGMVMLSEPHANGKWGVGIYENDYVKESGVWKIARLHFYMTALTDYDRGFLKSALPTEGQSALFPPDRPPSEIYRAFPGAYIPPFSFKHPVTGKSLRDIAQPADDVVERK
jgi:hypothetical protein